MMKNQLAGLMQQAQKMQENVKRMNDELADVEVEGQSGAGLVKVTLTCKYKARRLSIDPCLVGEDREMLEDLVVAAFNDAVRRAEETAQGRMAAITAGLPLPPGFKMPFL
jgi:DNA-binding YbaB/EbfC family protein